MIKKVILALFFLCFVLVLPIPAHAEGEFATNYNVTYDVDASGVTTVTEGITLKNLTERFYASSFSLTIGSTQISDVTAGDSQGALPVQAEKQGNKTKIDVAFNQQLSGLGKEYPWTLRFKSNDFASKTGKVWQVTIPRISTAAKPDTYTVTLAVPVAFGDPTTIIPEPIAQGESNGKITFTFNKDQLTEKGVLANFGTEQLFSFQLNFHIDNDGVLPAIAKLPLPANTNYQEILLNSISPKPENVTVDVDGNYIGWFKIPQKQSSTISVNGLAKLFFNNNPKTGKLSQAEIDRYTASQKYWEKDSTQIRTKLDEIFKDGVPKTNEEKARLINKYVVSTLSYDDKRLAESNFDRLGAATVLNNPTQALCGEFTDLFIALARAAGVPARMLEGYAYTTNNELRPLSLENVLHAWPEYYDETKGWVMIDPTWENTTGGVDYFSQLDLSHFVLAVRGVSSEEPFTADDVKVTFSDQEFKPFFNLQAQVSTPLDIFAGLPFKTHVRVENSGNSEAPSQQVSLTAARLSINGPQNEYTPVLPPFGVMEYSYSVKTNSLWESFGDVLELKLGGETITKTVQVKSFFSYNNFTFVVITILVTMVLAYLSVLFLHFKRVNLFKKPS